MDIWQNRWNVEALALYRLVDAIGIGFEASFREDLTWIKKWMTSHKYY
jgi:hypothetical protein